MKPILEISNLSKKYTIGHQVHGYLSLRERIQSVFRFESREKEDFWAIRDISFDVYPGDAIGIVGRNGAGKSTLLKILSKITPPTAGNIISRGRIASLLEVGTGFHPELSGRENIFFNGSLLGMRQKEIENKFDEILDFSGVEKFLDTPLKHYSSGMQLRLAFSVAAFLEPEILIIDEVLAVGDSVFQQKCIQKMTEVSESGRTILFVSHNFSSLRSLCKRGIKLDRGRKTFDGSLEDTIDAYQSLGRVSGETIDLLKTTRGKLAQELIFRKFRFLNWPIHFGEPIKMGLMLRSSRPDGNFRDLDFGLSIIDKNNTCLIHISNRFLHQEFNHMDDDDEYIIETENILRPGRYSLTLFLRVADVVQDHLTEVISFEIPDFNPYGHRDTAAIFGAIFPKFTIKRS
jgi:lipopolysaccharide transport system ATP-binding protein